MAKSRLVGDAVPMQINGVSQQSELLRRPDQVTEQINCLSSLVSGVTKRPPTEFISRLSSSSVDWSQAKIHIIHRDETEKYIVVVRDDEVKVFNLEGEEHTVQRIDVGSGTDSYFKLDKGVDAENYTGQYLTPSSGFRLHTIGDTTFIVNRNQVVLMDKDLTSPSNKPYRGLVWLKSAKSKRSHRVTIRSTVFPSITVSWEQDDDATLDLTHTTATLAKKLNEKFVTLNMNDKWKAGYFTNILYIESAEVDFSLDVGHDWSDTYIQGIKDSVTGVADLPNRAFPGMRMKVSGNAEDGSQGFWVKFVPEGEPLLDLNSEGYNVVTTEGNNTGTVDGSDPTTLSAFQSDFDSTADKIHITSHPFRNRTSPRDSGSGGERELVQYVESSSFSVHGLTNNNFYFVQWKTDDTIELSASQSSSDAWDATLGANEDAGTAINITTVGTTYGGVAGDSVAGKYDASADNPGKGAWVGDVDYEPASFLRLTLCPGKWVEDIAPSTDKEGGNVYYKIDADTMPHILVRSTKKENGRYKFILSPANGCTYEIAEGTAQSVKWGDRVVGDAESASEPTFIDTTINDIFEWRSSLGFAADQSFVLSERASYMNFWPITVATSLADSRIDVAASGGNVSSFHSVNVFQDELVGFTEDGQYTLSSSGAALTPDSVNLTESTHYESSAIAQPVNLGSSLAFATDRGGFSSISEYFVQRDQIGYVTENTRHIPHYIKGKATSLSVSAVTDSLVCTTDGSPNSIYLYQWFWHGEEKAQSSWSKWDFNSKVISASFFKDILYIICQANSGESETYPELYKLVLTSGDVDSGSNFKTSLDRRVHSSSCVIAYASGQSTITLPYSIEATGTVRAVEDSTGIVGRVIPVVSATGNTLVLEGDYSSTGFYVGESYDSQLEFSRPFMKSRYEDNPDLSARLQVQTYSIYHENTGHYTVKVYPNDATTTPYEYTVDSIVGSTAIGSPPLKNGVTIVPVRAKASDMRLVIHNDSHLPHSIVSAEWSARYNPKTYRR